MISKTLKVKESIQMLVKENLTSKHPFFSNLSRSPYELISSSQVLGQLYLRYQAGMHASRVMIYFLPNLNSPELRKKKLTFYIDDDGQPGGNNHHYQLKQVFENLGAAIPISDEEFSDLDELKLLLDCKGTEFVSLLQRLYPRSLGAWCVVEMLASDWMHAFYNSLYEHFPSISKEPYFEECFSNNVEERHGEQALDTTLLVLEKKPELSESMLIDAREMAKGLSYLWDSLNDCFSHI